MFAGRVGQREVYQKHLTEAAAVAGVEIDLRMDPADADPASVDFLIYAPDGPVQDLAPYTGLTAALSLWAGIEKLLTIDPPPGDVPLTRVVDEGMMLGMIDYVVDHLLRHHLDIDRYIDASPTDRWETDFPPLARERTVGMLGLGALGGACAERLVLNGFRVIGWSRSQKEIPGVECRCGEAALDETIAGAEILVLLLPWTDDTYHILNARRIALMPLDACLINAARGQLIDHQALSAGLLRHATMDVFEVEPLPPDDPYWIHPRVIVTPHIARTTRPETASQSLVAQIARHQRGESFLYVVDRARGY